MFSGNARKIATVLTANDRASSELRKAESAGDDVADSMGRAEKRADKLGTAFMASAAATAVLTGGLVALTRQHGRTEQTFARLQVVTGATSQEMEKLRGTAMQLGIDLPVAIRDAANAMEQLAFAGFSAEEAVEAAAGVADLSVASTLNMSEAARTTSSALRMFGLEAEQTSTVTSAMAATFSNSATTIREMGQAIEYVGATAASAGVSIQEVSAAVGVLADRGIRASRAGTALNTTLQRIISGSGGASSALEEIGVSIKSITDSQGQLRDLGYVLSTIGEGMDSLESDAERMRIATELAGRRGARALLPLLDNTDALNEKLGDQFRSEIKASIGELSKLNDQELSGVQEALGMEVSRNLTPEELITGLRDLSEQGKSTEEIAQRLQVALNLSSGAAQTLAKDITNTNTSVEKLAEGIGGATTASEIAASQMSTTAGMVKFMRSSFDAMTFTIYTGAGPAIKWFNQKLAAGINAMNNNETAMKAVGASLAALTGALAAATVALGAMYAEAKLAALAEAGLVSSTSAGSAAMWAYTAAASAKNTATALMTMSTSQLAAATAAKTAAIWGSITALWGSVTASLASAGAMGILGGAATAAASGIFLLWNALGPIGWLVLGVAAAIAVLVGLMKTDLFGAGDAAAGILGAVGDAAGTAWAAIQQLIGILFELVRIGATLGGMALLAPFAALLSFLSNPSKFITAAENAIGGIVDGLVSGAKSLLPGALVAAIPGVGLILAAAGLVPDEWMQRGKAMVMGFASGIIPDPVTDAISDVAADVMSFLPFSDAKRGPLSRLTASGAALVETLAGAMMGAISAPVDAAKAVAGAVMDVLGGIADGATDIGKKIAGGIADGVTGAASAVGNAVKSVAGGAKDAVLGAPGQLKKAGASLMGTVAGGVEGASDDVAGAVGDAASKARSYLPFSDAEKGPLSNLTQSGASLVQTIAKGAKGEESTLMKSFSSILGDNPLAQGAGAALGSMTGKKKGKGKPGAGGGSGVSISITQEIYLTGDESREEIRQKAKQATGQGAEAALEELEERLLAAVNL